MFFNAALSAVVLALAGSVAAQNGDRACSNQLCVTAAVNGSQVTYTLEAKVAQSGLGWMAVGWGSAMVGSPMVIVWPNSDGTHTLSQRQATARQEPQVVASPERVATLVPSLTASTSSSYSIGFSVPAGSDTRVPLIWAFSDTKPSSSAVDATLIKHDDKGTFTLDLSRNLASVTGSASPSATGSGGSTGGAETIASRMTTVGAVLGAGVLAAFVAL